MMKIDIYQKLPLDVNRFVGQSVAILGIKGSGKSNTSAVLAEELLSAEMPLCIIDVAGEYYGLREKFKIFTLGRTRNPESLKTLDVRVSPARAGEVAQRSYTTGTPIILDVSGFRKEERSAFIAGFVSKLWQLAQQYRYPYTIFVEEAHNVFPQLGKTDSTEIMTEIAAEGRKCGLGIIMVGQRAARLDKNILTQADIMFLHRQRFPTDVNVYCEIIPRKRMQVRDMVNRLGVGDALVLWDDNVIRHRIRRRTTSEGGYTPTLADTPSAPKLTARDFQLTLPV